jgi:hypothetical protein
VAAGASQGAASTGLRAEVHGSGVVFVTRSAVAHFGQLNISRDGTLTPRGARAGQGPFFFWLLFSVAYCTTVALEALSRCRAGQRDSHRQRCHLQTGWERSWAITHVVGVRG